MGERTIFGLKQACQSQQYPGEYTTAHLFAATLDSTETQSHPEHSRMQIDDTSMEVQGRLAEMD